MKEWLIEFAQTPAGSIICGGALMIALSVVILTNTSIGKKSLNKLMAKTTDIEKVSNATKIDFTMFKEEILKMVVEQLKTQNIKIEDIEKLTCEIGKTVNNAKTKELVKAYEDNKVEQLSTDTENNSL